MNAMDIEAIRKAIPAVTRHTYLNCGTYGPLPKVVADELHRLYRLVEEEGTFNPDVCEAEREAYQATRARVAAFLGAHEDEIALTANVTTGVNVVANGLAWRPGDEVIMTEEEHPGGGLPWLNLIRRHGIAVKLLKVASDRDKILEHLDRLITPRTRLIFVSHVSCFSGLRWPVAAIARLAHERGVLCMIDGAHAVGTRPIDVHQLGCDFYTGCGHKWLFAPQGTGFLYVRRDRLPEVQPSWIGAGSTKEWDLSNRLCESVDGARRFEFGTRPWILYEVLSTAIDFKEAIGLADIEAHAQALVGPFKAALREIRGITLRTPEAPDLSSSLVVFTTTGLTEPDAGGRLWREHNIITHYNPENHWMRLSVACFTTREELERVLEVLRAWQPHV